VQTQLNGPCYRIEWTKTLRGVETRGDPRNIVLDRSPDVPFDKLLWPVVCIVIWMQLVCLMVTNLSDCMFSAIAIMLRHHAITLLVNNQCVWMFVAIKAGDEGNGFTKFCA